MARQRRHVFVIPFVRRVGRPFFRLPCQGQPMSPPDMDTSYNPQKLAERAIASSFSGAFLSIVALGFIGHLLQATDSPWLIPPTGAVAGAVVVTFYSAMRAALAGAIAGSIVSLIYVIGAPVLPSAWSVLAVCGVSGLVAGILVSRRYERRQGAAALVAFGLLIGAVAGGGAALVAAVPALDYVVIITFIMSLLFLVLFQPLALRYCLRFKGLMPHWLGVGLLAATIAAVVGTGTWVLGVTRSFGVDPQLKAAVETMLAQVPLAGLGGALGGAVAGVLLEYFHVGRLERL